MNAAFDVMGSKDNSSKNKTSNIGLNMNVLDEEMKIMRRLREQANKIDKTFTSKQD